MKKIRYAAFAVMASIIISGCGGGSSNGPAVIDGPELDLSEALQLVVNQIYVKEWSGTAARPFFSVYIQDALSEEYLVCAGPDQSLDLASRAGIFYGNLDVSMVAVTGATNKNTPIFNITIVADQENPCPSPIADDDTIVGTVQINFGELLDSPIEFGEDAAYVTFIGSGHEDIQVPEMEGTTTDALTVGEIYFEDTSSGDIIPDYYMVLYVSNGSSFEFHSIIDPSSMPEMREAKVVYSWLSLVFPETEDVSTDEDLLKTKARIELLKSDGVLIGKTGEEFIGDIIGRKVEFTNNKGYIKIRSISN
jgi:hypothetical protein